MIKTFSTVSQKNGEHHTHFIHQIVSGKNENSHLTGNYVLSNLRYKNKFRKHFIVKLYKTLKL